MKKTSKKNKQEKQGISLIVLIITIIVITIITGAIVLSLDDAKIIDRAEEAVEKTNLKEVQNLATLIWADAYMKGITIDEDLEKAVLDGLEKEGINVNLYGITVTRKGVDVILAKDITDWVTKTVDGVPIPRGFVASQATGENTKNGGLVIYEGRGSVTDENVEVAKRTRNQYVWVPVENFGNQFTRQDFGDAWYVSNSLGKNVWEVVLDTAANVPLANQNATYMTENTLKEVQAMYASVKEYGGFYIARYEAGIDTQRFTNDGKLETNVYSVMGKIPYTYVPWGNSMSDDTNGAVEVARSIYPNDNTNTTGVVSTLTYGVQWDRTIAWWMEIDAKDGKGNAITSITENISYGNSRDNKIASGDLNEGAKYAIYSNSNLAAYQNATSTSTKASGTSWGLSTGALKVGSVNNIYDMAGNMLEWTMEGYNTGGRQRRGGAFSDATVYPALRKSGGPNSTSWCGVSFRAALYIK